MVGELIEKMPAVLAAVSKELPVKFPAHVSDRVFAGLESSAKQLAAG
jgi:serine/threonine-protein kinase HipA